MLAGHRGWVTAVAVTPDGRLAVRGSAAQAFGAQAFMIRTPGLYGASAANVKARTASLKAICVIRPKDQAPSGLTSRGVGMRSSGLTDESRRLITSMWSFCRQ